MTSTLLLLLLITPIGVCWELPIPTQKTIVQLESDSDVRSLFDMISLYLNYASVIQTNDFEDPIDYAKGGWPNNTFTIEQPASGIIIMPNAISKTATIATSISNIAYHNTVSSWTDTETVTTTSFVNNFAYYQYGTNMKDSTLLMNDEDQYIDWFSSPAISFTSRRVNETTYYYYKYVERIEFINIDSVNYTWSEEIETTSLFKLDEDYLYLVYTVEGNDTYDTLSTVNNDKYLIYLLQNELILRLQDVLWYSIFNREEYLVAEGVYGNDHIDIRNNLLDIYDYYENNVRDGDWIYHLNINKTIQLEGTNNGRYTTMRKNESYMQIPWFDNSYTKDFKELYNNGADVTLSHSVLYGAQQDVRRIATNVLVYGKDSSGNDNTISPPGKYNIHDVHIPKMASSDFDSIQFGFGNAPLLFTGTSSFEIPQRYINQPILSSISIKASPTGFAARKPSELLGDVTIPITDETYYDLHNTKWQPSSAAYDPGQMWTIGLSSLISANLNDYAYSLKTTSTIPNNVGLVDFGFSKTGNWQSAEKCSDFVSCYTAVLETTDSFGHLYYTASFPTIIWGDNNPNNYFAEIAPYLSDSLLEEGMELNNQYVQTYTQTAYLFRQFDSIVLLLDIETVLPGMTDIPLGNFELTFDYDFTIVLDLAPMYFSSIHDYPTIYQHTRLDKGNWTLHLTDSIKLDCVMDIRNNKDYLEVYSKNTIPIDVSSMLPSDFPAFAEGLYMPQTYGFGHDDSSRNLSRWNYVQDGESSRFNYYGTFMQHAFSEIDVDYLKSGSVESQFLPVIQPTFERAKLGIAAILDEDVLSYSVPLAIRLQDPIFKITLESVDFAAKVKDQPLPTKLAHSVMSDAIQMELELLSSDVQQVAVEIQEVSSRLDDEAALISEFIQKMKKMATLLQEDSFFDFFDTLSRDVGKKRPELGRLLHSVSRIARAGVTKRPGAILAAVPAGFSLFSSALSETGKHIKTSSRTKGMHYDDTSKNFIKEISGKPYSVDASPELDKASKFDGTYTIREPLSVLGTLGENVDKYANVEYPGIGAMLQKVNKNPTHQYSMNVISYENAEKVFTDVTVSGVSEMVPFTMNKQVSGKVYTQTFKTEWIEGNDRPSIIYNKEYYSDLVNRMQWEGLTDEDAKRNIQTMFDKYWDSQQHAIEELSDKSTFFPSSTYELVTSIVGDAFKKYNLFSNNCQDYSRDIFNFFMNSEIPKNMSPTVFKWIINDVVSNPEFVNLVNSLSSDV